jgi:hypothetical protein
VFHWAGRFLSSVCLSVRPQVLLCSTLLILCAAACYLQGRLLAYAGVGVVAASEVTAEWQELCLKVGQVGSPSH